MSDITKDLLDGNVGTEPLIAYPWKTHADDLIRWAKQKDSAHRAFAFDFLMSLAYVDTVPSLQKHFALYAGLPDPYCIHLGFINICAPLLLRESAWHYQKAAKPQSGAIGKLTSEVILRFVELLFPNLSIVKSLGGVGTADALLIHNDGRIILCEVKVNRPGFSGECFT